MFTAVALSLALQTQGINQAIQSRFTPLHSSVNLSKAEKAAFKRAIGNKQIVMLGELTHGDATSFEFKVELVKLLHQEMGFDVLIWESGLFDCHEMNTAIPSQKSIRQVAQMGVFGHWSSGKESLPVFEYVRQTYKTNRPLQMAGFDLQPSGSASNYQFPEMLDWFKDRPELTPEDRAAIASAFKLAQNAGQSPDPAAAMAQAQLAVYRTATRFREAVEKNTPEFKTLWKSDYELRLQIIKSAERYAKMLTLYQPQKSMSQGYNLREAANANNLQFLTDNQYKGKKLIVWAHNAHIFRGLPGKAAGINQTPTGSDFDSMTRLFAATQNKQLYILGFMAHSGEWSWLGNGTIPLQAAPTGSLESHLKQQSAPYGFLNLLDLPAKSPLNTAMPGIIDQQNPFVLTTSWPKGFDGIIYIEKMAPRHQLPN